MQPLPTDPFDLAILVYQEGEQREVVGRNVTVSLPLKFDFASTVGSLESSRLLVSEVASTRQIEFALPPLFFIDMSDLMSSSARRTSPPPSFYLAEFNYRHRADATATPDLVSRFLEATTAYGLLRKVANHEVATGGRVELVFLAKEKLLITPDYGVEELRALEGLTELEREFFISDTHWEAKKTILRTVLQELFGSRGNVRFAEVLASFGEIVGRAKKSYDLYVAEFSFEKVRANVEKEKAEFTTRLNKVFSDIQNQLLAVPAALVLVGGQMQNVGETKIANMMIWLGALIFSVLMDLLIRNQRNTLKAIKCEFDLQWTKIEDGKHRAVASQFTDAYQQIRTRYSHQQVLLWVIDGLVALALLLTSALMFWYSGWLKFIAENVQSIRSVF